MVVLASLRLLALMAADAPAVVLKVFAKLSSKPACCWLCICSHFSLLVGGVVVDTSSSVLRITSFVSWSCADPMWLHMSSVHRVFGLPGRRVALSFGSSRGSHRIAMAIQSSREVCATFPAHLHFLRLWMVIQSSSLSFRIRSSTSWVHRLIQSTHGSESLALSLSTSWWTTCCSCVKVVLSTSSSSSPTLSSSRVGRLLLLLLLLLLLN